MTATSSPTSPDVKAPRSPGPWVTATECVCGATYARHTSDASWDRAVAELRSMAHGQGDVSGGFRRRNAVLWVMRCQKLAHWYMEHVGCGERNPAPSLLPYPGFDPALGF